MTWKVGPVAPGYARTEFPTGELLFDSRPVYRKTFAMTHPQSMTAGTSNNTSFPGAGHGVGQMIRAELFSAGTGGAIQWCAVWNSIDVQRQSANILTLVSPVNVSINSGANSIRATIWYTKDLGVQD